MAQELNKYIALFDHDGLIIRISILKKATTKHIILFVVLHIYLGCWALLSALGVYEGQSGLIRVT